jgi:hypothetical protein
MNYKVDIVLTNGKTDSCYMPKQEVLQMAEAFITSGVLIVGDMTGDFATVYAKGSVFSFDMYPYEA